MTRGNRAAGAHRLLSRASRAIAALALLPTTLLPLPSAAQSGAAPQPPHNDRIVIPPNRSELTYRDPAALPRQLRAALAGCAYQAWLADFPLRVLKPDPDDVRLLAIAPCGEGELVASAAFLIGLWGEVTPVSFATTANPAGFTTTRQPGILAWDAETRTLIASRATDACPDREIRWFYRYRPGDRPFALTRIEYRPKTCGLDPGPWRLYWQAPDWQEPD